MAVQNILKMGDPRLYQRCEPVDAFNTPELEALIQDMFDTMEANDGAGLAAPQIGRSIRLFVVDTIQMMEEGREAEGIKMVFINAEKIEETADEWAYEGGCLSIPDIRGEVERPANIKLRWVNEKFEPQEATFTDISFETTRPNVG